ncbi:MAG TPA: KUP/HAK/KT family potassium transporter, partial [Alphaproteobacteria bacterium]
SYAMMTTCLLFAAWKLRWSWWPKPAIIAFCAIFLTIDVTFFVTNLLKVFDGGWLPILMGIAIMICMASWYKGLQTLIQRQVGFTEPIEEFAARTSGAPLGLVEKTGIFFSRTGVMAPVPLERMTNLLHLRFERVVIVSIRISSRPRVEPKERVRAEKVDARTLKIEVRYGYMQIINIPATIGGTLLAHGIDSDEALYIIGHERVIAPAEPGSISDLMDVIFGFLASTAERAVDRFQLPPSRTIEMGYPVYM